MPLPLRCIVMLWVGWLLIWLVTAPFVARTVVRPGIGELLADRLLLWGGAMLLMVRGSGLLLRALSAGPWEGWACLAPVLVGLALAVWARLRLGRNWSPMPALKEAHQLVRAGPYGLVRHPIYAGMLLALAGTALAVGTPAALAGLAVMAGGLALRIRREEAFLLGRFGDAYRAYRADVPAVVPRLGPRR